MEVSITGTPVIIVPEIHDYTDDPEDETSSIVTGDGFTIDTGSKTITLERDVTISEGATFTIPPDWTLDVNGHNFINAGTTVNLGDVVDGENVDGNGAYTVPGTVYTSTPVMSVAPSGTYHFTTRAEGYSAQTAVTFTITNTSENAGALIGLDAQLIGAGANDFILTKTGLGTTLAAEAQAVVTVVPNTGLGIGIHTATLSISSANGNTVNVGLSFEVATPYMLTVVKGIGSGPYAAGEQVEITANSIQGKVFDKWTTSDVTLGNANSTTTTFIMPANEVTVTANYKDVPAAQTYPVTVTGGSGSGDYAENAVVTITANAPAGGKVFDEWTSDDVTFANPNSAQTSFTMPDKAVTVTANYRDDPNGGGDDPNPPVNPPETDDGWVYDDGVWKYYIDGEAVTGWTHDGKAWYYFDSAGVMKTGWLYDQNYKAWFYLGGNGAMKTGWVKDDGAWYYLRGDGKMVASKWLHDTDGSWYYLSGNGKMLTGKQTIGGKVYSFKTDGVWVS
jgi:glucan-binding YG repeat protein